MSDPLTPPPSPTPAAQPSAPIPTPTAENAPASVAAAPAAAPAAPIEERVNIDYFAKVKLRVAQIISAEPVPKSKKLMKLQVDVGPTIGQRQVLAGIAQHYTPETLVGRKIVIVANLEPAKLMGLESQGMLLASSADDGSNLTLVNPGENAVPGSTVR